VGVATANNAFAGKTAGNLYSDCELSIECVPLIIRQMVSTLFIDARTNYERIFIHLLRYAQVDQSGRVATIVISNQWKLHYQDSSWPCCYATLNTYIRLLCALGILCKVPRRKNSAARYHLPLADYRIPPDALAALDDLIDPVQTKNKRVRTLAKHVKSRLSQLRMVQQESTMQCVQVDLDLRATLDTVRELISPLEELDAAVRERIFGELDRARDQLRALSGVTGGRFFIPAGFENTFSQPLQKAEKGQPVDSGAPIVDFASGDGGKQREDSNMLLTRVVDSGEQESIARLAALSGQGEQKAQNLPSYILEAACMVDSGSRNLPADDMLVDSCSLIDNDREISSKRILTGNQSVVIDGATPESTTREPRVLYQPVDARSARALAKFIEGHPGNFRSYITLTRKYHPQVIRAAIINMLAHTYFPDLDGDLPAEVDGELTGKVGRPRKPGAWVTTCCQAYEQYGIPPVMQVLLRDYVGSYNEIRQRLEALARELSSKQFWTRWQEHLLPNAEQPSVSQIPPLTMKDEAGDSFAVREGIPGMEVRALVDQINRDGQPYGITARPCLQSGCWEVEVELKFQGRTSIHRFRSKNQWERYLSAIERLPHATESEAFRRSTWFSFEG